MNVLTRPFLLHELQELQASLEDLNDEDLVACRKFLLIRVNTCLNLINESDKDNI